MEERPSVLPPRVFADPKPTTPTIPVHSGEIISVVVATIIADLTIFRGGGFTGIAIAFAIIPPLLLVGSPQRKPLPNTWLIGLAIAVLVTRLVWSGSALAVFCGAGLTCIFALALCGRSIHVLESFAFGWLLLPSGALGLIPYWQLSKHGANLVSPKWLNVLLPIAVCSLFGSLFIVANPDLAEMVSERAGNFFRSLERWLIHTSPAEAVFLAIAAVAFVGLLRPLNSIQELPDNSRQGDDVELPQESFVYPAFRNTMVAVTLLFPFYLVFEFATLWQRSFPPGFYYAGYAHEGAAWLTVALAVATAMLSVIFRGSILKDPRLARLKRLAWIWSCQNLILGVAVFNRLFIYIDYNGLTRMRIIGLFGISTVIVGFGMVVLKIARNRSFLWLLRRHLYTVAIATLLFALTPVDWIAMKYNVFQIRNGDPAPSVQISVHPISSEGLVVLVGVLNHKEAFISEGVCCVLAAAQERAEARVKHSQRNWSFYQGSDRWLLNVLRRHESRWKKYRDDPRLRQATRKAFDSFAYQWY